MKRGSKTELCMSMVVDVMLVALFTAADIPTYSDDVDIVARDPESGHPATTGRGTRPRSAPHCWCYRGA